MNCFPNSRVLPSEEPVFSLYMILINLQDTGLTISKSETFKLSRFFVSLSMDNPLSQIELVTCCRVKSDVSTWRAHRKKFLLPFWLSKLCSQMSSEFILINRMNMFGCCKGDRFSLTSKRKIYKNWKFVLTFQSPIMGF